MNVGLILNKHNRSIYGTMFHAMKAGLEKIGIRPECFENFNLEREYLKKNFDLVVAFTNAESKIKNLRIKQRKIARPLMVTYISPIQKNCLLGFHNREGFIESKEDDLYIYCDLLDKKYCRHFYLRDGLSRGNLSIVDQLRLPRIKDDGHVLIPQQVFPEGISVRGNLLDGKWKWEDWFREVYQEIRQITDKKIIVKPHPNRKVTPETEGLVNVEIVKEGQLLRDAAAVVTLSSKMNIEGCVYGIPTVNYDLNSMVADACKSSPTDLIFSNWAECNTPFWNSISNSIWSKKEIAGGDYQNYLVKELLPKWQTS